MTFLGEDADSTRPYQEPDDDQHNSPQDLLAQKREDSGYDQDHRNDPQDGCHSTP